MSNPLVGDEVQGTDFSASKVSGLVSVARALLTVVAGPNYDDVADHHNSSAV